MNTVKEKQHYVPQFYLKNFSYCNNKKQLGVYNLSSDFFINTAKLKTQAYKPFYYGKDGKIEDFLSAIEGQISASLKNILNRNLEFRLSTIEQHELLFLSVLTQLRNPIISDRLLNSREELLNRAKEIVPNDKNAEKLVPKIDKEYAIQLSLSGVKIGMDYCKDLKIKLLLNNNNIPFITSDNPFCKYNQFLENKNGNGGWTGYGTRGIQLFLPVSPNVTILIYDDWAYKIGDKRKDYLYLSTSDVNQLNLLQVLNCNNNLFFNEKIDKVYLRKLYLESKKFQKFNTPHSEVFNKIDENGKLVETSKFVSVGTTNPKIGLKMEHFTITKNAKQFKLDNSAVHLRPYALQLRQYDMHRRGKQYKK